MSCLTHLFGFLGAVYFTALFWRLGAADRCRRLSVGCFGASMCLLYAASSAYHGVLSPPHLIDVLRRLDHSAIYVLIAGTYTPIFAVLLRGRQRVLLLLMMWGVAAVGVACKWLLPWGAYGMGVGMYVGMGTLGLVSVASLLQALGARALALTLFGGACYTAGGVCDALGWPLLAPGFGSHEVLHVCDLFGSLIHVVVVVRYVLPFERPRAVPSSLAA